MLNADFAELVVEPQLAPARAQIGGQPEAGSVREAWDRLLRHARVEPFIRKMFPDQRRYKRIIVPHVVAYLGNAHKSRPYQIIDISAGGFCMAGEDDWTPGTEMPVTLQREEWDGDESFERLSVQAIVARRERGRVGFSIALTPNDSIAFSNFPVSHSWTSTIEMEQFIENLQKPKPARLLLVDCPRPRPLSLAERTERLLELAKAYRLSPASELWDSDARR
jgi:hypothetical protein